MSANKQPAARIGWIDLTVPNAEKIRDFYAEILGWQPAPVDVGDYQDYNMVDPEKDEPVVGICHKRGVNVNLPPQWMIYFTVPDLEAGIAHVKQLGGEIIDGARSGFCVIRDPAGAVCALFEQS